MLPPINTIRADLNLPPVASVDEFLRRAPLVLIASGKPFQYPQTDWGDAVQMIGPCVLDPAPHDGTDWLGQSNGHRPRHDLVGEAGRLEPCQIALAALADEPVHVVATLPAGQPDAMTTPPNATVSGSSPTAGARPCSLRGDPRRDGRDAESTGSWYTGMRRPIRTGPIRGRPTRRGSPVRNPATRQETVTDTLRTMCEKRCQ